MCPSDDIRERAANGRFVKDGDHVGAAADLDRVREILFGAAMRAQDEALERTRGDLLADAADMRRALETQLGGLERELGAELGRLRGDLEARFGELTAQLARENAALREELAARSRELAARSRELAKEKTDRGMLSELLTDLAARLKAAEDHEGGS